MPAETDQRLTLAELLAMLAVTALATAIASTYLIDRLALGVRPWAGVAAAVIGALVLVAARGRDVRVSLDETLGFLLVGGASLVALLWLAWPALLPLGSGSDLTHHLILVDYIERHGELPHEPSAVQYLGEMADYTPGLHLLTVIAGAVARTSGLHTIYPVVAVAVSLKFAIVSLILLRLLADSPVRLPLSVAGALAALTASTYTLGSFVEDSFLAQAVSELFAVAAWWALVWWTACPSRTAIAGFAVAGVAIFLTWPIWTGPPAVALAVLLLSKHEIPRSTRITHAMVAIVPIAVVALVHTLGRASQVSIVATSGAVVPPSIAVLGWPLPLLALGGVVVAVWQPRQRAALALTAGIVLQAAALWLVASGRTPYMAIKMTYLAIYPAIAFAVLFVDRAWAIAGTRARALSSRPVSLAVAWLGVLALALVARRDVPVRAKMHPVVSNELFAAGAWARTHVPIGCVDYLVGNEYTAYWLHLAVLGNPRISSRTGDDNTFLTQPSMARWLVPGPPRYAIANLAVLPGEIRNDVHVLQQYGQAAVIERRAPTACP